MLTVGICFMKKGGLLNSEIPALRIYTIKTPLFRRFFLGPKKRPIRGVLV